MVLTRLQGEYIMNEKVSIKISDLKVSKILNQIKKEFGNKSYAKNKIIL